LLTLVAQISFSFSRSANFTWRQDWEGCFHLACWWSRTSPSWRICPWHCVASYGDAMMPTHRFREINNIEIIYMFLTCTFNIWWTGI
jgi:hypothetical protein